MILPRLALADTLVLQSGQGRQHVHGRQIALAVHLAGKNDLSLGDVPGQVGDGVSLVILRHSQDGNHGDGAGTAHLAPGTLIHGGKVGIQVAGIAAAPRNLLACRGHLAQCLGVVGDVGHDDQHVHIAVERQVLSGSQRHTRRGDTLNGGVRRQVDKQHGAVDGTGAAEVGDKEIRFLKGNADSGEHDGKAAVGAAHLCLPRNLGGKVGVRQTGAGEDGQFLPAHQRIQSVDGGYTRLNELGGVVAGGGVDGGAVDIQRLLRQDGGTVVDDLPHAVEHAPQHMLGHRQLNAVSGETHLGFRQVQPGGGVEQLYQHVAPVDLQHAATAHLAVRQLDFTQLVVLDALDLPDKHQRSGDLLYGSVFPNHTVLSLSLMRAAHGQPARPAPPSWRRSRHPPPHGTRRTAPP